MPAVALTDHGTLGGAVKFYRAAQDEGIKPIIGLELYVATDRHSRAGVKERNAHLTLLAAQRGRLQEPRQALHHGLSRGLLLQAARRLGAAQRVPRGPHRAHRLHERPGLDAAARRRRHGRPGRGHAVWRSCSAPRTSTSSCRTPACPSSASCCRSSRSSPRRPASRRWPPTTSTTCATRTPTRTTRCSASRRRATSPTRTACATAATSSTSSRPRRWRALQGLSRGLRGHARDRRALRREPRLRRLQAADATRYPRATPRTTYLRELCEQGIVRRYGAEPGDEVRERLDFELGVIGEMGFDAYFLIVWDYVKFAKDNGIAVGPGRGSAAGSIVSYALGITDIDPLKYDLLFERFLNPGRKSMPDIDMDFSVDRRGEVIDYVAREVRPRPGGADHHLRHHGGAGGRARRGPRAWASPTPIGDKIAKMIPEQAPPATFERRDAAGRRAQAGLRRRRGGQGGRRPRQEPRGPHPQRLHPRGRRGHQRQAAHRVPAAAAEGRGRARHAVRHERRRQARPAQDGLPRPAQPRRHRGRARRSSRRPAASASRSTSCRSTTRRPTRCSPAATPPGCSSSRAPA